jgi:hypothetical protein
LDINRRHDAKHADPVSAIRELREQVRGLSKKHLGNNGGNGILPTARPAIARHSAKVVTRENLEIAWDGTPQLSHSR